MCFQLFWMVSESEDEKVWITKNRGRHWVLEPVIGYHFALILSWSKQGFWMGFKLNVWNKASNMGLDETTEAHTLVHRTPMTYMMTRWVSDSQEHLRYDNPTLRQMPQSPITFQNWRNRFDFRRLSKRSRSPYREKSKTIRKFLFFLM